VLFLSLALAGNVVLALRPGPSALVPALGALWADVSRLDSAALRLRHDEWTADLVPVRAAIEAQVPPDAPLVVRTRGVPLHYLAARLPRRELWRDDAPLQAAWRAEGRAFWVLELGSGDPLAWSLRASDEAPR
jgi:hypothetical protein